MRTLCQEKTRMSKRFDYVPAVSAGVLATVIAFSTHARSADDCIAEPNRDPPAGHHWYYHVDHANNRKCWRLGDAVAQRASPESVPPPPPVSPGPVADRPQQHEARAISKAERDTLFQEFIRWNELQRNFR
jgi:hypothetical protein